MGRDWASILNTPTPAPTRDPMANVDRPDSPALSPLLRERYSSIRERLLALMPSRDASRLLNEIESLLAATSLQAEAERTSLSGLLEASREQLLGSSRQIEECTSLLAESLLDNHAFDGQMNVLASAMREELLSANCPTPVEESLQRSLVALEGNQRALRGREKSRAERLQQQFAALSDSLQMLADASTRQVEMLSNETPSCEMDPLTGLPGLAILLRKISHDCLTALRDEQALALIAIDIDRLEELNLRCGRQAGDRIMRKVADQITGCLRRSDFAARGNRDCFFVVLSATHIQHAARIAEKIRAGVRCQAQQAGEPHAVVTVSCGVACYWEYDAPSCLIRRALQAMDRARTAGGDRVTVEDASEQPAPD